MGKLKAKDVARGKVKVKKKCCKSNPRCQKCAVVVYRLCQQDCASMCGKDFKKALAQARKR